MGREIGAMATKPALIWGYPQGPVFKVGGESIWDRSFMDGLSVKFVAPETVESTGIIHNPRETR